MNRVTFGIALIVSLVVAAPAAAQVPHAVRDGRQALSFGVLTNGSGMIGYSLMLSPRTALTIDAQADAALGSVEQVDFDRDTFQLEALLAPGLRHYMSGRGPVASYLAGRALFGLDGTVVRTTTAGTTERDEFWTPMAGGALGFGLEWFVTDAMSLRGEAALEGTYRWSSNDGPPESSTSTLHLGLGQSQLALSILF